MTYLEIIFIGALFNFACSVFVGIFYMFIFTRKHNLINATILAKNMNLIKLKQKYLRLHNINPYRQKDFLSWVPFMGGLKTLDVFVKGTFSDHAAYANSELSDSIDYLNNLIKINGLGK